MTVAIPTFRRWGPLRGAVASVASQSSGCSFEILIVDSADSASDEADLHDLRSGLPPAARVIRTRNLGTSHARNLALEEARSDLVAFLEDDAVAAPGWLAAIFGAYRDGEGAAAGGPIIPLFTATPPQWLREAYDLIANEFSELDHGTEACVLEYPKTLYGPNFSVRRRVAIDCGGFREDLGPRGHRWSPGEEVELVHRLQAQGRLVLWVPSAVVHHLVLPHKMTRGFYRRRSYARGMASALEKPSGHNAFANTGPRLVLRRTANIVYHFARSQVMWMLGRRRDAVFHDRIWARSAGILAGEVRRALRRELKSHPLVGI